MIVIALEVDQVKYGKNKFKMKKFWSFQVIGRLEIGGPKCQGSALNHWNEVCSSPKRQIADWHKLRE